MIPLWLVNTLPYLVSIGIKVVKISFYYLKSNIPLACLNPPLPCIFKAHAYHAHKISERTHNNLPVFPVYFTPGTNHSATTDGQDNRLFCQSIQKKQQEERKVEEKKTKKANAELLAFHANEKTILDKDARQYLTKFRNLKTVYPGDKI